MKRPLILFATVVCLALFVFISKFERKNLQPSGNNKEKTEVIEYEQTYIPKEIEHGYCWTDSIATFSNDKAWRCTTDNNVYDPCFETDTGQVVCGVSPEIPESGFELKLTKTLPKIDRVGKKYGEKFWRFELQNGLICGAITGTAGIIGEEYYSFACDKNAVLIGDYGQSNQQWKVKVVYLSDDRLKINKSEVLNIVRAWK